MLILTDVPVGYYCEDSTTQGNVQESKSRGNASWVYLARHHPQNQSW